jgi:hypothetical protein
MENVDITICSNAIINTKRTHLYTENPFKSDFALALMIASVLEDDLGDGKGHVFTFISQNAYTYKNITATSPLSVLFPVWFVVFKLFSKPS